MSNYPPQSFHPHPTRKIYIMQALSSVSPLKRKRQDSEASSSTTTRRPGIATTPGNPDWPCLDTVHCPDGRLKIVQKKDGNQFVVCDHNQFNNPSTCKVTLSLLKANRDYPHNCQLCLQDVGGSPSVGKATDEKDARGYTGEFSPTTIIL